MGRVKCPEWCDCLLCFRAKFTPNDETALQTLPKPKEAEKLSDEPDGVPFADEKETEDILIIRKIDPCIESNGLAHHTSRYEVMNRPADPQLVVRRGQSFKLELTLSRPYDDKKDGISFIFTVEDEEKPSYGHGSLVAVPLLKKLDRHFNWNVVLDKIVDNIMTVQVTTSSDAIVSKWHLEVDSKIIDNGAYSYSWDTSIYILFNPWCKQDQVYMRSEEWRDESILNEDGIIWRGTANRMKPVIWQYDQFEKNILECSLYLIKVVGKVKSSERADPVKTSRAVAAAVNSADDQGAVMGNWSEDHSGGTAPIKWLGSKEILQKYYKKKKPVKYGQCWVFSGVLTTICRAVGIPARTITNYSSAHDTQNSLTVDYFMDDKGNIMEELNSDSIWNFHVWNEVWMQRPDLGRDYLGWQAVDSTPQELSEELYRVGPASVFAVKQGEVMRPYDTSFLLAEVNADKVFWKYAGPTQPLKLLRKDIYGIGKLIITKAPNRFEPEDITASYKYPEKSLEERTTMLKALRQSENLFARYYLNEDFNDVYFDFALRDDIKIGQPFDVALVMKNRAKFTDYKIKVILRVEVVNYRGKIGDNVKNETFQVIVKPESTHEVKLAVKYEEYAKKLIDQSAFVVSCLATVEDTKFEYFAQDDFRVRKPDIKFVLQEKPVANKEVVVDVQVENPLPVPYRKGVFTVQAPGLEKSVKIKVKNAVAPGESAKVQFKFVPLKSGKCTIAAKFSAKEIDDVDGFAVIEVEAAKEDQNENNGNRT